MVLRVLRQVAVVVSLAGVAACGGVAPDGSLEDETGAASTPAADSADTSAMTDAGCGYINQRCCPNSVCYGSYLECWQGLCLP
jgi:hypothetical protein